VPVEFLSDEQAASYGRFEGELSSAELERFFFLDDEDRRLVERRRSDHTRLGFAVQLGTARFLGTFLADPLEVPWGTVVYLAGQLGVADPSVVKRYTERSKTPLEHTWEIREEVGYVDLAAREGQLRVFLAARAWTRPERPSVLFDQAVAWLRAGRVLLPGVSVLARLVAEVCAAAVERADRLLDESVGSELRRRLEALLVVPQGSRWSELDRLRRAPTRASGPQIVRALERAAELAGLGAGGVDVGAVPVGRLEVLARQGLAGNAAVLRRLPQRRRAVTLLATARALQVAAVDDALDLFAVLMATKLIGAAERASAQDQLRSLPRLRQASVTLAVAARVLLDEPALAGSGEATAGWDAAQAWERLLAAVPRERLVVAVATVQELVPDGSEDPGAGPRAELVKRYATVRPFLTLLADVLPLAATDAGQPTLAAVRGLADLTGRKRVPAEEVVGEVVAGSWRRLVYAPDLPAGTVDVRAYALCVLDALHRALRRRDVYAVGSVRWSDPRARLLDGVAWEQASPQVLTALQLTGAVEAHLTELAGRLDAAYTSLAARLSPPLEPSERTARPPTVRLEPGHDGRVRLHLTPLEAVGEPASLLRLRELVGRMLPQVDLPEVLLEVHAWTGYLTEFHHVTLADSSAGSRMQDLATSLAAVLVAEGCNLGFAPVIKAGHPALTRDRLSHVAQNYLRTDTLTAANARLIDAQAGIEIARLWGGGLVASVDGLRFVVPVRTLDAGPNPRYFGQRRGVTWLNAINDQVAGIGAVVVTGTMRDSLHVLDVILNRDGGPPPQMIATDTASYSDLVFGLFRLLGYQFSPRLADLPDQRLWRLTLPGQPPADYGALNPVAAHQLSHERIRAHWPDMLRVAGSLHTGTVAGYDLLRMLGRDGRPTPLGGAIAEYGRAAKTLHLLAMCDPDDESYRRAVHTQLTVQESRHRLARKIFHGQRGELRQRYRNGQEDQLGALGLVLNAVVLWNTRYTDAALTALREQGHPVLEADAARLSPLVDAHLNVHGRYSFIPAVHAALRPLRDVTKTDEA
jgi:TnpA family transposase